MKFLPIWIYKNLNNLGVKYIPKKGGGIFYYNGKKKFIKSYEIDKANKAASMRHCSEKEKILTFLKWLGIEIEGDLK